MNILVKKRVKNVNSGRETVSEKTSEKICEKSGGYLVEIPFVNRSKKIH